MPKISKLSRLSLMRRKSLFKTSRAAWADISSKLKIKASDVKASHTKKAWMWIPKKNSMFEFMNMPKRKSKSKSKSKTKKSKGKTTITTSRKDFDMCKQIDNALKNKKITSIIIKK